MTDVDILHDDVVILQHADLGDVGSGKIVVIERTGEQEDEGAWSLKRLIIERPRSVRRNEFGDEIDWDDSTVVLRSHNQRIRPWPLEPSDRYRVRAVFLWSLRPEAVQLVDADLLLPPVSGKNK